MSLPKGWEDLAKYLGEVKTLDPDARERLRDRWGEGCELERCAHHADGAGTGTAGEKR